MSTGKHSPDSDIVVRQKRRVRRSVDAGVRVRVQLIEGQSAIEPAWQVLCKTPAAVEYLRERLRGLMEELDGVRVE